MTIKALLLTVLISILFLIGLVIPKFIQNKNKLILFTTGLTFNIMIFLMLFDLIPEMIELLHPMQHPNLFLLIFFFVFLGWSILKILDFFVPEHHHEHHENNDNRIEHDSHLFHIGFITAISLILHNMLEGISIYITGMNDLKLGFIMAISVGLHNLPLGIEVSIGLEARKDRKIAKFLILFLLTLSSFVGAFLLFLTNQQLNSVLEGILLCITLGMIIYISFFELFPEIKMHKNQKELKEGILIGILLALLLIFL